MDREVIKKLIAEKQSERAIIKDSVGMTYFAIAFIDGEIAALKMILNLIEKRDGETK